MVQRVGVIGEVIGWHSPSSQAFPFVRSFPFLIGRARDPERATALCGKQFHLTFSACFPPKLTPSIVYTFSASSCQHLPDLSESWIVSHTKSQDGSPEPEEQPTLVTYLGVAFPTTHLSCSLTRELLPPITIITRLQDSLLSIL